MAEHMLREEVLVPFVDLASSHRPLREDILAEIGGVIDSGAFTNGPQVAMFEQAFADFCGAAECVGAASGLDALRLALIAKGLQPGDEVLVPANTFIATFEAVVQAGGVPVPVDASLEDFNVDPAAAEAAVTERTRFVMPVHLYGQMADMERLSETARRHDLGIIEDACQAHGAVRAGARPGDLAHAAAFSFYPGKNLGAFGDAGALTTDDAVLAADVRALREHGQSEKYRHRLVGYTSRLDTIQAIVLAAKLPFLPEWNAQRRAAAAFYLDAFADVGDLGLPPVPEGSEPVWHLFVVRTDDPTALAAHLAELGVSTGRHYPEPPHLSEAFRHLGYAPGAFPVAEALSRELLSLPIYPGISELQLEHVVRGVRSYFDRG